MTAVTLSVLEVGIFISTPKSFKYQLTSELLSELNKSGLRAGAQGYIE